MQQQEIESIHIPLPTDENNNMPIRELDDIDVDVISSDIDSSLQIVLNESESIFVDGVLRQDLVDKSDLIVDQKVALAPDEIVPNEFEILPSQIRAILHPAPPPSKPAPATQVEPDRCVIPQAPPTCKQRMQGCFGKLQTMRQRMIGFRNGTNFFSYNTLGLLGIEKEFSPKNQKPSLMYYTKLYLFWTLIIVVVYGVFVRYQKLLGSEKSQGLIYKDMASLTYPIEYVPMLFPAHTFSFFQKEDVVNRILCKTYANAKQCKITEEARCRAKGVKTQAYEVCMVALYTILKQDSAQFCTIHYNDPELWTEDLDPSKPAHYERKHQCYVYAGVPKGRQYCLDIYAHSDGWTLDNLFNCYVKNGVNSAKEQCQKLFPIDEKDLDQANEQAKKQLSCFGSKGVAQDKDYCDLKNRGSLRSVIFDRINCYDAIPFVNKATCDTKKEFFNWDKQKLQKCYKSGGYILTREFCNSFFVGPSQIDNRYTCYDLIGLNGEKDRDYCDLSYEDDIEKKYKCMIKVNDLKIEVMTMKCDNEDPEGTRTVAQQMACLARMKVQNPLIKLGEDYCFATFIWEDQAEKLQKCLVSEKAPQESTFCDRKFSYLKYQSEVLLNDPSLYIVEDFYACQANFGIPNNDQTDNNCAALALVKNDTIMLTNQIAIQNEELDQLIGKDTLIKKLKFVGGALKLFYKDVQDMTAYIVFADYNSSSMESFGKLTLFKDAPRVNADENSALIVKKTLSDTILPFKAEFLEGRSTFTWLNSTKDQLKEDGNWHFIGPNEIVIDLIDQKIKYTFQYDPASNQHTISSSDEKFTDLKVDLTNSGNLQTVVVENWQKSFSEIFPETPAMECAFAYGNKSEKMAKFGWQATFDQSYTVEKIQVFNFKNGIKPSLLENAEVFIGDRICAKIGNRPPVNQIVTVYCQNPDLNPRNVFSKSYNKAENDAYSIFDGTVGDSITIKSVKPGHQVICDLKVFRKSADQALADKNAAGKANCKVWQDECRALKNPEDKYNCLERYGVPKTPQYCLETLRAQNSQYPLKKKYECMQNPKAPYTAVQLHKNVTECLNIYLEKSTELCLKIYEMNFQQNMGFIGGNGTIESPEYFKAYGNLTQDIQEIAAAAVIAKNRDDFLAKAELATAAVSDKVKVIDHDEIEKFMCKHSFFYFYTNPFDDHIINPNKTQDEQFLDGQCQVFNFYDVVTKTNMSVLHWFMNDQNLNIRTQIQDEHLKKNLVVNKTEMNNQYFRLEFNKELEFMQTAKNQIYMRDQDPQNDELELPLMYNEQDYYKFISENITQKIYETEPLTIAEQKVDPLIMDAQPYNNTYIGMPVRFQKKFLGYLLRFTDVTEKVAIITPENEVQQAKPTDEAYQSQDKFPIHVSLRFDYTEMQFTFRYVQISDMIAQLGGIVGLVGGLIGQFAVYLVIAYVVELLFLIKRKYKCDERNYVCETLKKRIPIYKKVIQELMNRCEGDPKRKNELKEEMRSLKEMMPELTPELVDDEVVSDDEELPEGQREEVESKNVFAQGLGALGELTADFDDLYEDYKERLLALNAKYGNMWKELGIKHDAELFDEFDVISRMLRNRVNTPALGLIGRVKKNISFFGLYKLNDKIELDIFRLENMKKKLQNTILMLLNYQNKLMANLNDSKSLNYDHIEDKFQDISTHQPRQTEHARTEERTQKEYEEMIINIKNELFKLKIGIEDQNKRENEKLTAEKKAQIKNLRTELKRIMDTLQVQDISVKAHTRMSDMMNQYSKMDDKVVFSLEALCEFINLNQYDDIVRRVRVLVDSVDSSEIEPIRITVNMVMMAVQNIQIKWSAIDEILFNFIDKMQPNRISEIELCKVTQKVFTDVNDKFVRINQALAQIYRDDCE